MDSKVKKNVPSRYIKWNTLTGVKELKAVRELPFGEGMFNHRKQVIFVMGQSGMGKTTLVKELQKDGIPAIDLDALWNRSVINGEVRYSSRSLLRLLKGRQANRAMVFGQSSNLEQMIIELINDNYEVRIYTMVRHLDSWITDSILRAEQTLEKSQKVDWSITGLFQTFEYPLTDEEALAIMTGKKIRSAADFSKYVGRSPDELQQTFFKSLVRYHYGIMERVAELSQKPGEVKLHMVDGGFLFPDPITGAIPTEQLVTTLPKDLRRLNFTLRPFPVAMKNIKASIASTASVRVVDTVVFQESYVEVPKGEWDTKKKYHLVLGAIGGGDQAAVYLERIIGMPFIKVVSFTENLLFSNSVRLAITAARLSKIDKLDYGCQVHATSGYSIIAFKDQMEINSSVVNPFMSDDFETIELGAAINLVADRNANWAPPEAYRVSSLHSLHAALFDTPFPKKIALEELDTKDESLDAGEGPGRFEIKDAKGGTTAVVMLYNPITGERRVIFSRNDQYRFIVKMINGIPRYVKIENDFKALDDMRDWNTTKVQGDKGMAEVALNFALPLLDINKFQFDLDDNHTQTFYSDKYDEGLDVIAAEGCAIVLKEHFDVDDSGVLSFANSVKIFTEFEAVKEFYSYFLRDLVVNHRRDILAQYSEAERNIQKEQNVDLALFLKGAADSLG